MRRAWNSSAKAAGDELAAFAGNRTLLAIMRSSDGALSGGVSASASTWFSTGRTMTTGSISPVGRITCSMKAPWVRSACESPKSSTLS